MNIQNYLVEFIGTLILLFMIIVTKNPLMIGLTFPSNSSTSIPRRQVYNNSILTNAIPNPHQGGTTDGNTNFSNNRKLFTNTLNNTRSIKNTYNDTTSSSYIHHHIYKEEKQMLLVKQLQNKD
jgi:hypothetical protein